jgi:hypothetical protein
MSAPGCGFNRWLQHSNLVRKRRSVENDWLVGTSGYRGDAAMSAVFITMVGCSIAIVVALAIAFPVALVVLALQNDGSPIPLGVWAASLRHACYDHPVRD